MKVNLTKTNLNYKNVLLLRKFINPEGKILPRRLTQVPLKQHKIITNAIKKARIASFIPFKRMTFY
uniref:Small ribosomal subunit protein bS18c n=2 Tax=Codium TaxID=3132 RepID=A0A2P0QJ31_9CHLO|nr:30S ribosomal protein S18 [Codium simulans]YP_009472680.1 ribosomal protein S18 [Codium arenicola]ANJ70832.1 30S ribosomal protein S18 [Codium simulans]ARO74398.1 ribosomal protein S18 [Codium arenicola]